MIEEQQLRQGLQKLLKNTESAIRDRLSDEPILEANLRERHTAAVRAERTEGSAKGYSAFADEAITQAAVHWLLGCVFVRFLEDNGWLDERNAKVAWIAGPSDRLAIAKDRRTLFLRPDPNLTDRDYLLQVFAEVAKLPGVAGLFDPKHNSLYSLQPTAQGAATIVEFFQKVDPDSNNLIHDFTDPVHGTRFLGDLYQNLSESSRKRYALCQTPGFIVDFILDRTLTPALDTFGLEKVRLIDPACGSGHFLLAAFSRLFRAWQSKEPGTNPPALVQRALDAVYGVDLNPFAVEIARFRLLIAALKSSGIERLRNAPNFCFNLAAGDSLLHGSRVSGGGIERNFFEDRLQYFYDTEDAEALKRILGQPYHVVVGNPPYINVSDAILREAYRSRFVTCHGKYQLGVPFTERFLDLTLAVESANDDVAGWMGMIVSNAFMKRAFGKQLIENYLRHKDLTHVIDTSGVYIPGHGTPTTIMFARNRQPVANIIRAVRGIRGEAGRPEDPANAPVWREVADHVDEPGFEGQRVSIGDVPRSSFDSHPWAMGGGGAAELSEALTDAAIQVLGQVSESIGITSFTLEDDIYILPNRAANRNGIPNECLRPMVIGDVLRDWAQQGTVDAAVFPYDQDFKPIKDDPRHPALRYLWVGRTSLANSKMFGNKTKTQSGLKWYEFGRLTANKLRTPFSIAFAFVGTHNHFVIDRGGKVFKQSSPIIKLPSEAGEAEHLSLVGLLNSSTACLWLKQKCHNKGTGGIGGGLATEYWEQFYEFDADKLMQFPIPGEGPLDLAKLIQAEADMRVAFMPENICKAGVPSRALLDSAREKREMHLARMIALQEELDWHCYKLYGLLDEDITATLEQVPPLELGQRSFEILMARKMHRGELETTWFERHGSKTHIELPQHWPDAYRQICLRRLEIMRENRDIALIEQPEHKRRWSLPSSEEMERTALKEWLLDRIELSDIWKEHTLISSAQLRDALARDAEWLSVAELRNGGPIEDLDAVVSQLATPEAVPFLPVLRYTESGLRKRDEWEQVWLLQRKEDAGEKVEIPVPPRYGSKDFLKADYWRLRGGLDVPKERFILYQGFQRDADDTPVLGWAGWSRLEQAKALAAYYQRMRTEEGWEPQRLRPILAGLLDLREWLKQWHDDLDPETGLKLGTYFSEFAEAQCQELGFSPQEVLAWQPPPSATSRRRRRPTS